LFFISIKILLYFRSDEGGLLWIFVPILKLSSLESAFAKVSALDAEGITGSI
jgi:hypothetical protein